MLAELRRRRASRLPRRGSRDERLMPSLAFRERSSPLPRRGAHAPKGVAQQPDLATGIDFLGECKAPLIASLGVVWAVLALVDCSEQTKTFHLPPPIPARPEVTECGTGKIARALVFASLS